MTIGTPSFELELRYGKASSLWEGQPSRHLSIHLLGVIGDVSLRRPLEMWRQNNENLMIFELLDELVARSGRSGVAIGFHVPPTLIVRFYSIVKRVVAPCPLHFFPAPTSTTKRFEMARRPRATAPTRTLGVSCTPSRVRSETLQLMTSSKRLTGLTCSGSS